MPKISSPELLPEGESSESEASVIANHTVDVREGMAGLDMDLEGTNSVRDSVQPKSPQPSAPVATETPEAVDTQEVQNLLDDIADSAQELTSVNMEHRVGDFRDGIPIWGSIRSHERATREGEVIQNLKDDLVKLQALNGQLGLQLDLKGMQSTINALTVPSGVSKLAASILIFPRALHRSIFTSRAETIRQEATKLRRALRK